MVRVGDSFEFAADARSVPARLRGKVGRIEAVHAEAGQVDVRAGVALYRIDAAVIGGLDEAQADEPQMASNPEHPETVGEVAPSGATAGANATPDVSAANRVHTGRANAGAAGAAEFSAATEVEPDGDPTE